MLYFKNTAVNIVNAPSMSCLRWFFLCYVNFISLIKYCITTLFNVLKCFTIFFFNSFPFHNPADQKYSNN